MFLRRQLFATKSLHVLLADMESDNRLKRALGSVTLTALGIGIARTQRRSSSSPAQTHSNSLTGVVSLSCVVAMNCGAVRSPTLGDRLSRSAARYNRDVGFAIVPVRVTLKPRKQPADSNPIITTSQPATEPTEPATWTEYHREYARRRVERGRCRHCGRCRGCGLRRCSSDCGITPAFKYRCARCQRRERRRWRKAYGHGFATMARYAAPEQRQRARLRAFLAAHAPECVGAIDRF